jgi:hypothetical protein
MLTASETVLIAQKAVIREIGKLMVAGIASIFLRFLFPFPLQWEYVVWPSSCPEAYCYPERLTNGTYFLMDTVFWLVAIYAILSVIVFYSSKFRPK